MKTAHAHGDSYQIFEGVDGKVLMHNDLHKQDLKHFLFLHQVDVNFKLMNAYFNNQDEDQDEQRAEKSEEKQEHKES